MAAQSAKELAKRYAGSGSMAMPGFSLSDIYDGIIPSTSDTPTKAATPIRWGAPALTVRPGSPYLTPDERAQLEAQMANAAQPVANDASRGIAATFPSAQKPGAAMAFADPAQPMMPADMPALRRGGSGPALKATAGNYEQQATVPKLYTSGGYIYSAGADGGYVRVGKTTEAKPMRRTSGQTVSGDDNAFQPTSVQSSSRWQTGY